MDHLVWTHWQSVQSWTMAWFGMSWSSTPRWCGSGWSNTLRLVVSQPQPCSKVLTKLGVLGMSYVGGTIYIFLGSGRGNIVSMVGPYRVTLVIWGGGPWLGGPGGLSMVGSWGCYFLRGGVSRPRSPSPLDVGTFSWFLMHLVLTLLAFSLTKCGTSMSLI